MRELDDSAHRVDRAERIGNVRDRNQSRSRIDERFELVHPQHTRVIDGCHAQPRPGLLTQELPRDDVRMVLHLRHEDLIACLEPAAAIALRNQVDRLCRAPCKYDFLGVHRIDECSHLLPRRFERVRRALAQLVDAAVYVRIERGVVTMLAIDHAGRFLARRCVIEVDERLAMNRLFQDREVLAPAGDIELEVSSLDRTDFVDGAFHDNVPTATRSDKIPCNRSRSGAMPQRLTISSAKA